MLLQGGYPAKLKKVLIVTAPLWFKAPFKILRLFVREKLRERVYTVSVAQLSSHIPRGALPASLGGQLTLDHEAWLATCLASHMNHAAIDTDHPAPIDTLPPVDLDSVTATPVADAEHRKHDDQGEIALSIITLHI